MYDLSVFVVVGVVVLVKRHTNPYLQAHNLKLFICRLQSTENDGTVFGWIGGVEE